MYAVVFTYFYLFSCDVSFLTFNLTYYPTSWIRCQVELWVKVPNVGPALARCRATYVGPASGHRRATVGQKCSKVNQKR
jgi:hypothetical protein